MRKGGFLGFFILGLFLVIVIVGLMVGALALKYLGTHEIKICSCDSCEKVPAGPLKTLGEYNASSVEIAKIVGDVVIKPGNFSIVVKSNLPIEVSLDNSTLFITCSNCSEYKNGRIIIEGNISKLEVGKILGTLEIYAPLKEVEVDKVLGELDGYSYIDEFKAEDVLGEVNIKVRKSVEIEKVLGEVDVEVPDGYKAELSVGKVLGEVHNSSEGDKGKVEVRVSKVLGELSVENE
ncbi:hypothetical protein A3L04_03995 [Thermococcus chitonophagus]|uniref:Adhesin domain-containing protein n=1 Tax=Thermococcus chitonophagus TaxID=54262 RepID=A0A161K9Q3_9EURY|nr:hypothetical protein [Thermococcus chitonophagus]ASJ16295.1 hypothetical protein A3L04_03995 [Thermococcus chitonophagus]CUX78718.1 hypothetical protein CHITON_1939 [Thermococcus chitonophagus]